MRTLRILFLILLLLAGMGLACKLIEAGPAATPTPFTATAGAPATNTPARPTATGPSPTESPPGAFSRYEDEEVGLSFQYPDGWTLEADDTFVTVVSSAELLTAERFDGGAGMLLNVGSDDGLFTETTSIEGALVEAIDEMGLAPEQELVAGPTATTIKGQEAATATALSEEGDAGVPTLFYYTLIRHEGRVALLAGVTLAEGGADAPDSPYAQTLATMAESVTLSRPAGELVAGSLAYGDTVEGEVAEDESVSWTFAGEAGERVNVTVEPLDPELDVMVDLLDGDGNSILPTGVVDLSFGTEVIEGMMLPEDGEYALWLGGYAGSGGAYRLTLNEVVAGATGGDGPVLAIDNSVAGLVGPDETDTYLLAEAARGRPVTVLVEPAPDFDVVVDYYGPDGALLESSDGWYEGEAERLSFTANGGSIQVRGYAGTAGDYTITLLGGSPAASGSTVLVYDTLPDADAQAIYPFYAPARELVSAYVEPEADFDLVVEVWEGDDETLLETVDHSYETEQINVTIPDDGNYYFVVYGFEGATGSYTITMQGTAATIFELAPGDEVSGQMAAGAVLEYGFLLNPGAEILFTASGEAGTDVTLEILDLDDNVLAAADETAAGDTETLRFRAPGGEETLYILRVAEYGGNEGAFSLLVE